jgi:hypothetical protein
MANLTEIKTQNALKQLEGHRVVNDIRAQVLVACKKFKVSWVELGQLLHAVEEDKLYHAWGYEKLEDYTVKELGFDKKTAIKLLKSYLYLINEGAEYLREDFAESRDTELIPSVEEINFLRLAMGKKELLPADHAYLKNQVFVKGKVGDELKRDLVSLMRQRKPVDTVAEQEKRKNSLINGLIQSLTKFHAEMLSSKLIAYDLIQDAEDLLNRLKEESARG